MYWCADLFKKTHTYRWLAYLWNTDKEKGSFICWIGGMADALDLGSSVFDVRVQVPYPVPRLPFETKR